ncbi:MAG: UDP-N-acetylmuramate dehydrogenase [Pseudobdellovibrionaceae bacterium]
MRPNEFHSPSLNVRGRLNENAPLGQVGWFRAGGAADLLFRPADRDDLQDFLVQEAVAPVTVLGVLSNTIIRDGGVEGITMRLGREFADMTQIEENLVRVGSAALDVNAAEFAATAGIAGLEFLCGIPGSIGGALMMNAGAYGREIKDVLVEATFMDRSGNLHTVTPDQLHMSYRHADIPQGWIALEALLRGERGNTADITAHMTDIRTRRAATQPIRSQTGGSTFANPLPQELEATGLPETTKAWQLVDRVGGRGLIIGGAQMSEMHANFMINTGGAKAADLENLGEEIRRRVLDQTGITLRWEIRRIGRSAS